jgi:general secretion pathway protein C
MRWTTMAIDRGDRRVLLGAGLLLIAVLLFVLLRGTEAEPAPLDPAPVGLAAPAAAPAPPPAPPPAAPMPDASNLRLYGLLATGAIIAGADGNQHLVRIGREILPGLTLRRIEQQHAVLAGAGGEVRLGFDGAAQPAAAAATPARTVDMAQREEGLRYRLGLEPNRVGARTNGFRVRAGARLPALEAAGIRPGDLILGVNGSVLDEERMLELPWQIANSARTEFEVERGGRRLQLARNGGAM